MKNDKEILKQGIDKTNKPSFLINAKRVGTLMSNKVYNHFLKIVLKEYEVGGNHNGIFYTTMPEIKQYISGKNVSNKDVWDSIKLLQNTQIEHIEDYEKKDKNWASYQLMGSCEYTMLKDLIEFDMSPIFLKKLMELKKNGNLLYAALEDRFIKNFNHKHSLVLYEFLKDYEGQHRIKKSLSFYRTLLNMEEKYPAWKSFKKYVFERSFNEILEKTNMNISWEYEKDKINNEWYIRVDFKKSIKEQKQLFSFEDFKRTFIAISVRNEKSFRFKGEELTINENGYIVYLGNRKSLHPSQALEIWERLYNKNYLVDEEKFYRVFKTTKEDFEMVEYMTREEERKIINEDLEEEFS